MLTRCLFSAAAVCLLLLTSIAEAQQRSRGRSFGTPRSGALAMLRSEDVQKELELVDDQKKQLSEIGQEMYQEMRGMFSGLRDLSEEERRAKFAEIREKMEELTKDAESKVNDILLPNQRDRLAQIELQAQMRRSGTVGALDSEKLKKALNLTDEQLKQLKAKEEELTKSLREQTEKLRADAKNELLGLLTSEQRAKLEELTGEAFDYQPQFGRGGFGGRRPGGGRSSDGNSQ